MKKIVVLLAGCMVAYLSNAQITTDEQPYGLKMKSEPAITSVQKEVRTIEAAYISRIVQEDLVNDEKLGPLRYAFASPVNYTLENSGAWQTLADGSKLWRLKVSMPGALSTNTYYDKFWLPEGAKFFVYSDETKQSIGAITSEFIEGNREKPIQFATAIIYGENVVFEYYQPASVKESAIISISRIDYGYRFIENPHVPLLRDFGDADSCNININCSQGNNWQTDKHAVARISIQAPGGSFWGSGALVNNTSNNFTPYLLTANHCLKGLDATSNANAGQWIFYWEYEHPGCNNSGTEPTLRTTVGATVVANNQSSDFALLQLTQNPRNVSGVVPYYLGWDRSGNSGTTGVGIHHPDGDVKKISTINQIQNHSGQLDWNDGTTSPTNTHWDATFQNGLTEGGSSGSPLLNSAHKVIGQLHGGPEVTCNNNTNYVKHYGKLNVSWTGNGATDSRRRLKDWLDPTNTNLNILDGRYVTISSSNSRLLCASSSITCTVTNPPSGYTWTQSGNLTPGAISGNSLTFTGNGGGSAGWIAVNAGGIELARYAVWVGTPTPTSISGPTYHPNGQYADYHAVFSNNFANPTSYQWILNPMNGNNVYGANSEYFTVAFYNPGSYQVVCRATNACGQSEYCVLGVQVYNTVSYSAVVANGSKIVTVTNISKSNVLLQSSRTTVDYALTNVTGGTTVASGKMPASGGTLDFSHVSAGIYILRIDAGSGTPETFKLVLK